MAHDPIGLELTGSGAEEGHSALWLSTEAEAESARVHGSDFCPTLPMSLPEGIDVLWVFIEPVALRYDGLWSAGLIDRPSAQQPHQ